jgi:crotonobetainyl-CoA:carnitine CoA-transferase CaiB-like acyl-CoA transferase
MANFRGGIGDHVTALTVLSGILAALLERERTGEGRTVDVSLLRTGAYCFGWDLSMQLRWDGVGATQARTEQANPMINSYRAADGAWFWLLGVEADRLWPKLLAAIDRPEWADDERFNGVRARRHNAAELVGLLDELFATRTRAEWTAIFDQHDVWWAPVNTPAEVIVDPQAIAAGTFVDVPEGGGSPAHRAVASPVQFDGQDVRPGPVPALGQHTDEILRELGIRSPNPAS